MLGSVLGQFASSLPDSVVRLAANVDGVARTADLRTALRYGVALVTSAKAITSQRSLRSADWRMRSSPATFDVDGTRITLDGNDFSGARELYCRRVYFGHPAMRLQPGSTVVDIGANTGLFTLLAAKRGARVLAVDAQAGFAQAIRSRVDAQGCGANVTVECALVGGRSGVFAEGDTLARASHFVRGQEVRQVPFDQLIASHGITSIDFLKMDIEGSEFALFREGTAWLSRVRQAALEVHTQFGRVAELREAFESAGMSTSLRDDLLRPVDQLSGPCGYLYAWRN